MVNFQESIGWEYDKNMTAIKKIIYLLTKVFKDSIRRAVY